MLLEKVQIILLGAHDATPRRPLKIGLLLPLEGHRAARLYVRTNRGVAVLLNRNNLLSLREVRRISVQISAPRQEAHADSALIPARDEHKIALALASLLPVVDLHDSAYEGTDPLPGSDFNQIVHVHLVVEVGRILLGHVQVVLHEALEAAGQVLLVRKEELAEFEHGLEGGRVHLVSSIDPENS